MFVFELFVSKYLSAGPVNQLDKPSALSTIKKPWNFKLLNAIFSTMFITSVYFLDCKRARICAKVENDRAGQTKGREQEWKQRMRLRGETGKIRVHFARESHADASHLEKPILKKTTTTATTFLQSSVFWISQSKCGDFLEMSGWAYGSAFRFSLLSWRSWHRQMTTEIHYFLDTGCLTKQMIFFSYCGTSIQGAVSAPRKVSLE